MVTTTKLELCAPEADVCFNRGDTFVFERVIRDELNAIIDITGFAFAFTVDSQLNPPDNATQIFSVAGVVPVGTDGVVQFAFSVANWLAYTTAVGNPPNVAFYGLQMTDASGGIRTIRKGTFEVEADILH